MIAFASSERPIKNDAQPIHREGPPIGGPSCQTLEMLTRIEARTKLEEAIPTSEDVYIPSGVNELSYLASLADDVRSYLCDPFEATAKVMPPGFPFASIGETLSGYCIAHNKGYWLVFQPKASRFLCFWGESPAHLGAHGVFGSPLYCWSA